MFHDDSVLKFDRVRCSFYKFEISNFENFRFRIIAHRAIKVQRQVY